MKRRALPTSRLKASDLIALNAEMIEQLFNTPFGRLPLFGTVSPQVRRHLDALAKQQPGERQSYTQARLAIADNKRDEARKAIDTLPEGPSKRLASKFFAASESDEAKQKDLVAQLSPGPDVEVLRLNLGLSSGFATPLGAPTETEDPLQWVLSNQPLPSGPQRTTQVKKLFERLRAMNSAPLYEKCLPWAERNGLTWLAQECKVGPLNAQRAEINRSLRGALKAGSEGKFSQALDALWKAQQKAPLDQSSLQLLLRTAMRLNDTAKVAATKELLLMRGMHPATLSGLMVQLQAQNSSEVKGNAGFNDDAIRVEEDMAAEVKPMETGTAQEALP
jgi:hypothetical protein